MLQECYELSLSWSYGASACTKGCTNFSHFFPLHNSPLWSGDTSIVKSRLGGEGGCCHGRQEISKICSLSPLAESSSFNHNLRAPDGISIKTFLNVRWETVTMEGHFQKHHSGDYKLYSILYIFTEKAVTNTIKYHL